MADDNRNGAIAKGAGGWAGRGGRIHYWIEEG